MLENEYQAGLIKRIKERFPDSLILKNDPNYIQGVPDLSIFTPNGWAMLEVKKGPKAPHRPNQDYYVSSLGEWSFTSFIFPENEEEVLDAMERALQSS